MYYKELQKIVLLLIIGGAVGVVSAQAKFKVGDNPFIIEKSAVLEAQSNNKGFLPPRMTKKERTAIVSPVAGLIIWCTDCDSSTEPNSGQFSVFLGTSWALLSAVTSLSLTTDTPVRLSAVGAKVTGTLTETFGVTPTETGIVYREITANDFGKLPVLDDLGNSTAPNYKVPVPTVTVAGGKIEKSIDPLSSGTGNKRPYYFRTFSKGLLGISYGNTVIFNCAPPDISTPVVTNEAPLPPAFKGTLTVNAGTPKGTVTEYGYCSSTTKNLPTTADNKVILSSKASIVALDTKLNADSFTSDPTIDLLVTDYDVKALVLTYFRYYVIANGVTTYSPVTSFTPVGTQSNNKDFFPPRMTKKERTAIVSPVAGMIVWCTDCDSSTKPNSGQLSVFLGTSWASLSTVATLSLTTDSPIRLSTTGAKVTGTLTETFGVTPTETGIVYREITSNDFGKFPVLDDSGNSTAPNYKALVPTVTVPGGKIEKSIDPLSSGTGNKRPYYFRTFSKGSLGISYGNTVIFNCAPPDISTPVVTNEAPLSPTFKGPLTVNAGTPKGTVTEYGYCSSTTNNPPTIADNKMTLSNAVTIAALNTILNADTFTADPTINLAVTDYNVKAIGLTYFRYYVTANGVTTYSPVTSFTPVADPVTGGTAIAKVTSVENLVTAVPFRTNLKGSGTIKVNFNVTKAGTYAAFEPSSSIGGATKGLTMAGLPSGNFVAGNQSLTFTVSGTPVSSTEGNSFTVSRITTPLKTGSIKEADNRAICDGNITTEIVPVRSKTGKYWMDRNLGAFRKAQSVNDYKAYGCLYQWGRGNDDHASIDWINSDSGKPKNGTTNKISDKDKPGDALFITSGWHVNWRSSQNNELWRGENDGINNPCPHGYRVPSNSEFYQELVNNHISDISSGFYNFGFVASGYRSATDGSINGAGDHGSYWTSTPNGNQYIYATLGFGGASVLATENSIGLAVRCIQDY